MGSQHPIRMNHLRNICFVGIVLVAFFVIACNGSSYGIFQPTPEDLCKCLPSNRIARTPLDSQRRSVVWAHKYPRPGAPSSLYASEVSRTTVSERRVLCRWADCSGSPANG